MFLKRSKEPVMAPTTMAVIPIVVVKDKEYPPNFTRMSVERSGVR